MTHNFAIMFITNSIGQKHISAVLEEVTNNTVRASGSLTAEISVFRQMFLQNRSALGQILAAKGVASAIGETECYIYIPNHAE